MEIKSRSKSLGPGPNVGALSALHRDEWSSLFPMLNEYGLNSESVRAMTTAVRIVWSLAWLFLTQTLLPSFVPSAWTKAAAAT